MMSIPILSTKFFIPTNQSTIVPRLQLVERVERGLNRKLTLLSAPAGFGKTTLLADCIGKLKEPVGWLSLDENDNDKTRFLKYFINALRQIEKGIGENSLLALLSQQPLETENLVAGLINEITDIDRPIIVVLDDYHVITNTEIQKLILFLLDNQPSQMHIVISSRADPPWPLARFRARGEIEEIRVRDLRFTFTEISIFLNDIMKLQLSPEDIIALEKRTEGWVAGLQMAAISVQNQQDKSSYINSFTGSHRFVLDFLVEEVLSRISDTTRDFLVKTSILDQVNGSLCDFVLGGENSQSMLWELEQKNLFLIPLDDHRNWYRYHHLFADLLRNQLNQEPPELVRHLHQRAGMWFEEQGTINAAIEHFVTAGDFEHAAEIVEKNVIAIRDSGELPSIGKWLCKIPDEIMINHPWLYVARAWISTYLGQADRTRLHIEKAEHAIEGDSDDHIRGHVAALRSDLYWDDGKFLDSIDQGYEALDLLPKTDPSTRIFAGTTLAAALRLNGNLDKAHTILEDAIILSKTYENQQTTVQLLCSLAAMQIFQWQLPRALDTLNDAVRIGQKLGVDGQPRPSLLAGPAYISLANVFTGMNRLDDALENVQLGIKICEQWGLTHSLLNGYLILADAQRAKKDTKAYQHAILSAERIANQTSAQYLKMFTEAEKAQFWLYTGNIDAVIQWANELDLSSDAKVSFTEIKIYDIYLKLLMAQKDYQNALSLLSRMLEVAEKSGWGRAISYKIYLSIIYQQIGNESKAIETIIQALEPGRTSGNIRAFIEQGEYLLGMLRKVLSNGIQIDFTTKLIRAIEDELPDLKLPKPASDTKLIEPLSDREIEVLRFLNSDLSVPEITSHLHISVSTLRTHIRNIYKKLGVNSRFEATIKGKELGLN